MVDHSDMTMVCWKAAPTAIQKVEKKARKMADWWGAQRAGQKDGK